MPISTVADYLYSAIITCRRRLIYADNTNRIALGEVGRLCRRWKIAKLEVFGSALCDDFRDDSDVDFLYTPGRGSDLTSLSVRGLKIAWLRSCLRFLAAR